jgi:hypothetical protein
MVDLRVRKTVTMLSVSMLFLGILTMSILIVSAMEQTAVRIEPQEIVLGSPALEDIVNTTFSVATIIENVTDLYGFDIQFCWNTTYLEYVSHVVTVPVEDYPDPVPPSPYAGILHGDTMKLKEAVDETGSIPLAEPRTMAWFAYSCKPWLTFDGNGTVFIMTFKVKCQPLIYELPADVDHVNFTLHFVSIDLGSSTGLIRHSSIDGKVKLYARNPSPDINKDGIVNVYDVVIAANAYGSRVDDPEWNQLTDLAPEWGKIDIYDLVTCLYHYGEKYP